MPTTILSRFGIALTVALICPISADGQRPAYPKAPAGPVVDDYFGTRVPDPYRWMEDLNSPEVARWVKAENALTNQYLAQLPARDSVRRRLTELWNYAKVSPPVRQGGKLFYRRNSGLQRQAVLFERASLSSPPTMVLDPNRLSPDGSIAFAQFAASPTGEHVAFALSEGGADWQTVYVRALSGMKDLADTVRWVRFSGLSWTRDGKGFFYSRYPEPPAGRELSAALEHQRVYFHRVGTRQSQDRLIFERPTLPKYFVGCKVTDDGRYLLCTASRGADNRNRLFVADLGDPMRPKPAAPIHAVVDVDTAEYSPLDNVGSTLYLLTTQDAPNRRVVALDLRSATGRDQRSRLRTVVPEGKTSIAAAVMAGGRIVVQYLEDVKSVLRVYSPAGRQVATVALPGIGSVTALSARNDAQELFYTYTSPLVPPTVYRYDFAAARSTPFDPPRMTFDASGYETLQAFAASKDGTRVPLFITIKKGVARDGTHPTMLYAYGGFDVNLTPTFTPLIPAWLERGGIYVTASLRGGAEYGESWHEAGMRSNKQNVFDDFIGAAEYLVREKYTSPAGLVVRGGSNGGLLVGAVTNQRPDLFAVALPAVGVMDMLRYDRFTGGAAWATEYGSATDSTAFPSLYKYSPLQNIRPGTCYPATLATTADHDDRVVPSHTFKYIAALQAAQGCDRPVLVRVETQGSHGYRPTDKAIAELADQLAFSIANVGVRPLIP